jgi:hypothetical protein
MDKGAIQDLQSVIYKGDCVAFIGSGPSSSFYKSWQKLVLHICAKCGISLDERHQKTAIESTKLLKLIDLAREFDVDTYRNELMTEYSRHFDSGRIPKVYELLYHLSFASWVTLNFDPFLAALAERMNLGIKSYPTLPATELLNRHTYYAHGRVKPNHKPMDKDIIFGQTDFERAYSPEGPLHTFFRSLFNDRPVLFIGCSLSELEIQVILRMSQKTQKENELRDLQPSPPKYILLSRHYEDVQSIETDSKAIKVVEEQKEYDENERYSKLGLKIIRYDNEDGTHQKLTGLLQTLVDTMPPVQTNNGFADTGLKL